MSTLQINRDEEKDRRKGLLISIAVHAGIILLALLPLLTYQDPPPGQEGVLISFGNIDQGSGDDRPDVQQEEYVEVPTEEAVPEDVPEPVEAAEAAKPVEKKVMTVDDSEIKIRKQKELEAAQAEAEKVRQAAEDAAKKQAAEDAARKQAAADAAAKKKAEYDAAKKQYGDFFGGSGKGKTDKPGNQGDPGGDPDATKLEGISKGSGVVGDGLTNRGVKRAPEISDSSQKTGRVVIYVCVDRMGNVTKADYTQRGSTTSDARLVSLAKQNAYRYLFSQSNLDEQCGTITYDFKVK